MKLRLLFIFSFLMSLFAAGQVQAWTPPDYKKPTVKAAQEALNRLGYDTGTPDGVWGGKSRAAMNALRAANGLPEADSFTGSSLALIHRLSPGETTLSHPGLFITDAVARRSFLKARPDIAKDFCPYSVGDGQALINYQPRLDPGVNKIGQPDDDDWWSEIGEGIMAAEDSCMAGHDNVCQSIIDFTERWADAGALQTKFDPEDERYENTKSSSNYILTQMMIAYGLARQFVPVPADREATILDWMKDRVDRYHHVYTDPQPIGGIYSALANNHGVANMLPAMTFGILVGDRSMIEPAISLRQYAMQWIRKDGSLPTEMSRGGGWFHYSVVLLERLMAVSELAAAQGIDLYGEDAATERYTVPHAVSYMLDALADFDVAEQYSKKNVLPLNDYEVRTPMLRGYQFGFLAAYIERFGEDENVQHLRTATVDSEICGAEPIMSGKFQDDANICQKYAGQSVPLAEIIRSLKLEPSHQMDYAAGCLQATRTWDEILGLDSGR